MNLPFNPSIQSKSLGNQLFLYFYAYLYAYHKGISVPNIYKIDFFCENKIKPLIDKNYKINESDIDLTHIKIFPDGRCYPHDVRIFTKYRDILRNRIYPALNLELNDKDIQYDIIVHVRTDNIGNHHRLYTALPQSFYQRVINNIENQKFKKVLILSKKPHDNFTRHVLQSVIDIFEKNNFNIKLHSGSSQIEDFEKMLSSKIYIMSCSTFSFWAGLLGSSKEVHIPYWGLYLDNSDDPGSMYCNGWKSTNNKKIILYNDPVKHKIREINYKDLYDIINI